MISFNSIQAADDKMSNSEFSFDQILNINQVLLDDIVFKVLSDEFAHDRYVTLKVKNYC